MVSAVENVAVGIGRFGERGAVRRGLERREDGGATFG